MKQIFLGVLALSAFASVVLYFLSIEHVYVSWGARGLLETVNNVMRVEWLTAAGQSGPGAFQSLQERMVSGKETPVRVSFNNHKASAYASRLLSVMGSMLVAVLTDRALIVANWTHANKYIQEPVSLCLHKFPAESEFNMDLRPDEIVAIKASSKEIRVALEQLLLTGHMNGTASLLPPASSHRVLIRDSSLDSYAYMFAICADPVYYARLLDYGLVERQVIDTATLALSSPTLDHQASRLEDVLRVGFSAVGSLLRKYWLPEEPLAQKIDTFTEKYLMVGGHCVFSNIRFKGFNFPVSLF